MEVKGKVIVVVPEESEVTGEAENSGEGAKLVEKVWELSGKASDETLKVVKPQVTWNLMLSAIILVVNIQFLLFVLLKDFGAKYLYWPVVSLVSIQFLMIVNSTLLTRRYNKHLESIDSKWPSQCDIFLKVICWIFWVAFLAVFAHLLVSAVLLQHVKESSSKDLVNAVQMDSNDYSLAVFNTCCKGIAEPALSCSVSNATVCIIDSNAYSSVQRVFCEDEANTERCQGGAEVFRSLVLDGMYDLILPCSVTLTILGVVGIVFWIKWNIAVRHTASLKADRKALAEAMLQLQQRFPMYFGLFEDIRRNMRLAPPNKPGAKWNEWEEE